MSLYNLKNKDQVIAVVDFVPEANAFVKIIELCNIDVAPITIKNATEKKHLSVLKELNHWYQNRGIPQYRDEIDDLLLKLNINSVVEQKHNCYGLSLSDQYWFHDVNERVEWKDVNFFTNDFDYLSFANAVFSSNSDSSERFGSSPNFATDGMVKKAWVIEEGGQRTLLKGGYKKSYQEPFNELLASNICEALGIEHTPYELRRIGNQIVSACPCFINEHTELIPAIDIFFLDKKDNQQNDFNYYISVLEKNGITDAREQLENMIVLDYIMMNEDRHLRNFGIIRNVETLKWMKVAPIYDTGQSLLSQTDYFNLNFHEGHGKFFTNVQMPYDKIIKNVKNLNRYDFSKLEPVINTWRNELLKWNGNHNLSDERTVKLVEGLKLRVKKISELQMTHYRQNRNYDRSI